MTKHGLFIPSAYQAGERRHLVDLIHDRFAKTIEKHVHDEILTIPNIVSKADTDTLIIAQDTSFESVYEITGAETFENLSAIKAQNPDRRIVVYYTARDAADAHRIRALPSFNAAAANDAVDLIFMDMPTGTVVPGIKPTARNKALKGVINTLLAGGFEGRVRSPELVEPTQNVVILGDLQIDRSNRTVTYPGQGDHKINPTEAAILGTLAAYQNSWVPAPTMMANLYATEDLARSRDPKTIDVHINHLKKTFARIGTGKLESIWGIGRYIRASDFRLKPPSV